MEYINAFLGKPTQPSDDELAAALGGSTKLWNEFIKWMADEEGVDFAPPEAVTATTGSSTTFCR